MNSKYQIGDILYWQGEQVNKHYLIEGIGEIGYTPVYEFRMLETGKTVNVAISTIDSYEFVYRVA